MQKGIRLSNAGGEIQLIPLSSDSSSDTPKGDGFPYYNVDGPVAKRMIDLQLHKHDLVFVAESLRLLTHKYTTITLESEAIWTSAIVRFFKCFSSSGKGRTKLSCKRVFKSEPEQALVSFDRLETLRNKTLVHDQNSWMQGKIGVPIAFIPNAKPRMGPPSVMTFVASTLDDESVSNLTLLTQCALNWIEIEYAEKERLLTAQLSKETAATILARGILTWTAPSHETAKQTKS